MKKQITSLLCLLLIFFTSQSFAAERFVTNADDDFEEGTLRTILYESCETPGDDEIRFEFLDNLIGMWIRLHVPLVIPRDCQGTIEILGTTESNTAILDGSEMNGTNGEAIGESCILFIYSNNNKIGSLNLVGNDAGASICVFGQNNIIESNYIGFTRYEQREIPNRYGIIVTNVLATDFPEMTGEGTQLIGNVIQFNESDGIVIEANSVRIEMNQILQNSGTGILIQEGFQNIVIGGTREGVSELSLMNEIANNGNGGVFVLGGATTRNITISINTIYNNNGLAIDLGNDGVTLNDYLDLDDGVNGLLNYTSSFQAFPLDGQGGQKTRYWIYTASSPGTRIEYYLTSVEDFENFSHGGGQTYLTAKNLEGMGSHIFSGDFDFQSGDVITTLILDEEGNTSEFSPNIKLGVDHDLDGIPDEFEISGDNSSSPDEVDSDGDGLPDSVEDKNRNGIWEPKLGETAAFKTDSDDDGISDWAELHGKDTFAPGRDSDPLSNDTDGDGLSDGAEDTNGNGIWEVYLGETDPRFADSDRDGTNDLEDNCPTLPNPSQLPHDCSQGEEE